MNKKVERAVTAALVAVQVGILGTGCASPTGAVLRGAETPVPASSPSQPEQPTATPEKDANTKAQDQIEKIPATTIIESREGEGWVVSAGVVDSDQLAEMQSNPKYAPNAVELAKALESQGLGGQAYYYYARNGIKEVELLVAPQGMVDEQGDGGTIQATAIASPINLAQMGIYAGVVTSGEQGVIVATTDNSGRPTEVVLSIAEGKVALKNPNNDEEVRLDTRSKTGGGNWLLQTALDTYKLTRGVSAAELPSHTSGTPEATATAVPTKVAQELPQDVTVKNEVGVFTGKLKIEQTGTITEVKVSDEAGELFYQELTRQITSTPWLNGIMGNTPESVDQWLRQNNGVLPAEFLLPARIPGVFHNSIQYIRPEKPIDLKQPVVLALLWTGDYKGDGQDVIWHFGEPGITGFRFFQTDNGGLGLMMIWTLSPEARKNTEILAAELAHYQIRLPLATLRGMTDDPGTGRSYDQALGRLGGFNPNLINKQFEIFEAVDQN